LSAKPGTLNLLTILTDVAKQLALSLAEKIIGKLMGKLQVRHVVGFVALALGSGTFSLSAWAWSIILRFEIPVGLGLAGKYLVGVAAYIGTLVTIWSLFPILSIYMFSGGIIAISPTSGTATFVLKHLFRKKQNRFIRAMDSRLSYIRAWVDVLLPF
jgi:hypothetical protein